MTIFNLNPISLQYTGIHNQLEEVGLCYIKIGNINACKLMENTSLLDKHRWFSGRIIAFQAVDPGSIPGRCIFAHPTIFLIKITLSYYHLLSNSFIVFMLSNSSSYFKILKINQVSG